LKNTSTKTDYKEQQQQQQQQALPKVIWEESIATLHGREWTRPLHVLLAAQYPLQMNPITHPWVCYIHINY